MSCEMSRSHDQKFPVSVGRDHPIYLLLTAAETETMREGDHEGDHEGGMREGTEQQSHPIYSLLTPAD